MVNRNELRYGNWVTCYNHTFQVGVIEETYVEDANADEGGFSYENMNPILLTPEILIKSGFEYKYLSPKQHYFDNGIVVINTYKTRDAFYYESQLCDVEIKYVHEFQNLYYCLTGKELEITF